MKSFPKNDSVITAVIPTIGRVESLTSLLQSLAAQTRLPDEIIVADASNNEAVEHLLSRSEWTSCGLVLRHIKVAIPNAVRQRRAAIAEATGDMLLLLDDDVLLESDCLEALLSALDSEPGAVAMTADFNNQSWSRPTRMWRWYLRWCCGFADGQWQGRVIGPLLRFGYDPVPDHLAPMQWLGAGNSLIRRCAYEAIGGFSDFFLYRCTMNEDVDLGLKLSRVGGIFLCPKARLAHLHAPSGRVTEDLKAEDDLYNRFLVLRRTCERSWLASAALVALFFIIETISSFGGLLRRQQGHCFSQRLWGRLRALCRIFGTANCTN